MNRPRCVPPAALLVAALGAVAPLAATSAAAQPARRAATLEALSNHSTFFHGEEVVLVADAEAEQVLTWLTNHDDTIRVLALDIPPPPEGARERLEVIGTFWDVGRLNQDDPRLAGLPITRIADQLLRKPWPARGELPLVIATSSRPAESPSATTLRSIVLEPDRYEDAEVTVTGRFRGRNLYGDMPQAPDESRWDFVLRSADAALWVVGREPKGDDFELDILARVDTGRWLEAQGTVRVENGMVLMAAEALTLADAVPDRAAPAQRVSRLPPPEVIFSTPLPDDTDVATDSMVRVQFSRDMDAESFQGQVRARYGPGADGASIPFELEYRGRNRVLEMRFEQLLEPFRNVTVQLLDGVTANDGTPMAPWTLSFFVGG